MDKDTNIMKAYYRKRLKKQTTTVTVMYKGSPKRTRIIAV